ncbi:MAG: Ig-like domain-containing protein [Myxococcota bacterium]
MQGALQLSVVVAACGFTLGCTSGGGNDHDGPPDEQDVTPPIVVGVLPVPGALGVSLFQPVEVRFSEAIDATTAASGLAVHLGEDLVPGTLAVDGAVLTMTPEPWYVNDAVYSITIGMAITDLAGNPLANEHSSIFTTAWSLAAGTPAEERVYDIAVDGAGDIVVCGYTYGSLVPSGQRGASDAYVIKVRPDRTHAWTSQFGGSGYDVAWALAADGWGNLYVAGATDGSLGEGANAGGTDAFLAKISAAGVLQWTTQLGSAAEDRGLGVAINSYEQPILVGETSGELLAHVNAGGSDLFWVRFNDGGGIIASGLYGSSGDELVRGADIDDYDNLFVTGTTTGVLEGDQNRGYEDGYVVKLNAEGEVRWVRQIGSTDGDYLSQLATDSSGRVVVVGTTYGGVYGSVPNNWNLHAIAARFDATGLLDWAEQLSGELGNYHLGVTVDADDHFYITGYDFDAGRTFLRGYTEQGINMFHRAFAYNNAPVRLPERTPGTTLYLSVSQHAPLFDGTAGLDQDDVFVFKMGNDGMLY